MFEITLFKDNKFMEYSITEDILTAPSLNAFENRLGKHWQIIIINANFNAKNKYVNPEGEIIV